MRRRRKHQEIEKEFQERVVQIRRVSKTVAGGKRFRFSALVVVGDGKGRVGVGLATATQTPQAIRKAVARAEKNVFRVPLLDGTIAHEIKSSHGASTVLLLPATQGTGVIAGATVRALCEAAGIKNIRT
ncbi:30S ribosomal protein S5, partial [bacterium]|nr:30S ribosomal protein S5 [bacterium]